MTYLVNNGGFSTLASGITTTTQTSITLAAGHGVRFPSPTGGDYTLITLENAAGTIEIVSIVGRSTDVLTVGVAGSASADSAGRGQESTAATTWSIGDIIEGRATAAIITRAGNAATLTGIQTLTNKTFVTPALGTPVSCVATNLTGTASALTAGNVTTNANLTGVVTSTGNATAIADAALSIAKTSGLQTALDDKASLASNNFTGGQNEARSNITQHATTMDFWAAAVGNVLDGTGSAVTITAIVNAPQAGASRDFYPLTGTILTQGATFDIDGAVTRTSVAGECWTFVAKSVSTYRVFVRKADGTTVVVASAAEVRTGAVANKAIAPDALLAALGFSARYNSGNQTITSAGLLTLAHGLGREPIVIQTWLKCLTAELNYSIGDKLYVPGSTSNSAVDNKGLSVVANSTNLVIRFGAQPTAVFSILNKTTGELANVTNTNWALIVEALA